MTEKKKFSRDKESKIRAIIDTTIELINEKGPASFSVNEIPGRAGLSIGTIYNYFPKGKDDIIAEILRKNITGFIKLIESSTKYVTSIEEAWAKIIKAYMSLKREYLSLDAFLAEVAPRGSKLFNELAPVMMDFYGDLNRILSRFDSFGELSEEQITLRLGLSFSIMRTVVLGQSMFPMFESDEELLGYLFRVVQAAFEPSCARATRKMEENPLMIAYCGLDCAECEAYITTQNNDFEALMELAKRWGENHDTFYRPEDIECGGCQSDKLNEYCNRCGVRECGMSHGFETCAECQDYPCDKLNQEWKSWHAADWTKAKAALDEKSS